MPKNQESVNAATYICECGKNWRVAKAELESDARWQCKCGRTIVVQYRAVFSYPEKEGRAARIDQDLAHH